MLGALGTWSFNPTYDLSIDVSSRRHHSLDRVVGALTGYELGGIDVRLAAIECSGIRPQVERPSPVVPEVAQQPPATLSPAVTGVIREHEGPGSDAGP